MRGLRTSGFTLVELMIVVVIVGVLATVAYPSYEAYMKKSRRSEAQQLISAIAAREAQYLINSREYTNLIGSGGLNVNTERWTCNTPPTACSNAYFDVSVTVDNKAAPPTFTALAAAKGKQFEDGHLTIDHTGKKERRLNGTGPDLGW